MRKLQDFQIKTVKITDLFGLLKKRFTYPANTTNVKLDISGLQKGVYMVIVNEGAEQQTLQLVVN